MSEPAQQNNGSRKWNKIAKVMLRVGESNPALPRSVWIVGSPLTGGYTDRYTNADLQVVKHRH